MRKIFTAAPFAEAKCDLTICRLTETSGPVNGGKETLLFCDKINKDDIQVRFYEEKNDQLLWEGFPGLQALLLKVRLIGRVHTLPRALCQPLYKPQRKPCA